MQIVSSASEALTPDESVSASTKLHELQQKEASKALEYLNELDRQKKIEKLEELKRNKQRLMELLKEKEAESKKLAQLHTSLNHDEANPAFASSKSPLSILTNTLKASNSRQLLDVSNANDTEIENTFRRAENDFDMLLPIGDSDKVNEKLTVSSNTATLALNSRGDSTTDFARSPSDLLWNQMKKQLYMRESLRNKKKELEDLIRDEYRNDLNSNRYCPILVFYAFLFGE